MLVFGLQALRGGNATQAAYWKPGAPAQQGAYRLAQLLDRLQLADKSAGPRLQTQTGDVFSALRSQYQGTGAALALVQAANHLKPAQARQGQVKNQHVRFQAQGLLQGVGAVVHGGRHLVPFGAEQRLYRSAQQRLLVCNHNLVHDHRSCEVSATA
ncbi:hypothetical protein D3C85_1503670 [compost metagenome]